MIAHTCTKKDKWPEARAMKLYGETPKRGYRPFIVCHPDATSEVRQVKMEDGSVQARRFHVCPHCKEAWEQMKVFVEGQ